MIISFLTLFLGLAWGERPVEVAVRSDVAAVELRLDGFVAGRLEEAPWKTSIDFGPDLVPHDLVAIAFDKNGTTLGTARQSVNLPRPSAEASWVLELPSPQEPRVARLSWHCVGIELPKSSDVTFDGATLDAPTLARVLLPSYDASRVHILRADLDFGRATATAVTFVGGQERDQTGAELTAVPVAMTRQEPLPAPASMSGWFLAEGKPVRVEAVEEGPADVAFVIDESAERDLRRLGKRRPSDALVALPTFARFFVGIPVALVRGQPGYLYHIFPNDGPLDPKDGDIAMLLPTRMARLRELHGIEENLSLAVASAAPLATQQSRRRAIVVVLGPSPRDFGKLTPALAKQYLDSLRVPLRVLRVGPSSSKTGWETIRDVATRPLFREAINDLGADLERQRIVWVEGRHLPQTISLSPEAKGIELAR